MAALTEEKFDASMESFAKIVKEGFDAVDQRFDVMESVMKSRFDEIEEEFRKTNVRIDGLYVQIDGFTKLHQKLDIELTALRHKYDLLAARVARLEGAPA